MATVTDGTISGGCVCSSLRFDATAGPLRVTICHCLWCQRRTGSAFGVEVVFRQQDVHVSGSTLKRYRHVSDESGRWVEQSFCACCGSNLGLTLEAVPGIRSIAAGAFDDPSLLRDGRYPVRHVFTRTASQWVDIADNAQQYEQHFRE